MLERFRTLVEYVLQRVVITLVVALTAVVVIAVIYRKLGNSLAWYDEVASILLAWLTYYGAALAALNRQHIGFENLLLSVPPSIRAVFFVIGEVCVFGFFILLAWMGWVVLVVLEGDTLVSLPQVSVQITQSVIPIGAALFVLCEALSLPGYWRQVRAGVSHELPPASDPPASDPGPGDPSAHDRGAKPGS